jgi:hypothetical protein
MMQGVVRAKNEVKNPSCRFDGMTIIDCLRVTIENIVDLTPDFFLTNHDFEWGLRMTITDGDYDPFQVLVLALGRNFVRYLLNR